jgi:hypothetical protein
VEDERRGFPALAGAIGFAASHAQRNSGTAKTGRNLGTDMTVLQVEVFGGSRKLVQDQPSTSGAPTHAVHEMTLRGEPSVRSRSVRPVIVMDSPLLHLRSLTSGGYRATRVFGWDALLASVRRCPPATIVVVELLHDAAGATDPRVQELLSAAPLIPVVAAVDLGSATASGLRTLLQWGVSEVMDVRLEAAPEALEHRFRAAHARPFKRRVEAGLSHYVSAHAMTLIRAAADVACDGGLSPDLAQVFGVNERTVGVWCGREGVPPPRRLLAWARVLLAAGLLEEPGRSWTNVALSTGYVDSRGLRRVMDGFVPRAKTPTPAKRPRFADAIAAFEADLHRCREELRATRRKGSAR